MLIIKRKLGESFMIGDNIVITLHKAARDVAHFAIDAPTDMVIVRTELIAKKDESNVTEGHAMDKANANEGTP